MLINLRNALMTGKRLPYDAEVEYLESTGTQYIDTGMYPTNNATTIVDAQLTRVSVTGATCHIHIVDSKESWNSRARTIGYWSGGAGSTSRIAIAYGSAGATPASYAAATNYTTSRMIYKIARNVFSVGSIYAHTFATETFTSKLSMKVLANAAVSVSATAAKLYGWKHYEGDVLLQDCIPVRVDTTGYMYDRVSRRLFGNAGTGDFVLGPDVVPVEYIESHGTEWIDTEVNLASGDIGSISVDGQFTNNTKNEQFNGIYAGFYFGAVNYSNTGPNWSVGGTQVGTSDMSRHTFTLTGEIGKSKTIRLAIDGSTFTNTRNIAAGKIGLFNIQGQNFYSSMKMWGSSISVNDAPVRKYYPVRVGTDATSWEGAIMDVLTRRIYRNAGTGAFTYGNDLKYPIPAE